MTLKQKKLRAYGLSALRRTYAEMAREIERIQNAIDTNDPVVADLNTTDAMQDMQDIRGALARLQACLPTA